jgi:Putative peptidoglycan binding domain
MNIFFKQIAAAALAMLCALGNARAYILDEEIFSIRSVDALAPRDEHGLLHQGKVLNPTDWDARDHCRWVYYFKASEQLVTDPAYVGAVQRDLRRLGYYCGRIDGIFTAEVSDAIARLQKNHSMRVTGTLTDPVRRALHLP